MAGSNSLYLEPIINGAVGDMGANISAMNTQLSETTRILMNILNNQGLEQHQAAYNGATFSALTLTDSAEKTNFKGWNGTANPPEVKLFSATQIGLNYVLAKNSTGGFDILDVDLTDCETLKLTVTTSTIYGQFYLTFGVGNEEITERITPTEDVEYVFNLPTNLRTKLDFLRIYQTTGATGTTFLVNNITAGANLIKFQAVPALVFSASNLLTYDTTVSQYCEAVYNMANTVFVTIPDIQGVATWVSALLKGNLEGVSVALVDNTTHELIKVLPTATSDISDVQQLSGLALMVTFAGDGNSLKYMSGFSMRYY